MKRSASVLLWLAVICASSSGFAQRGVVLFMDATRPIDAHAAVMLPSGNASPVPNGFFVQGQESDFVVTNRKFLSDYSVNIDGFTAIQNFPIEDLDEAANLTTPLSAASSAPVSKGLVTKGLAATGVLSLRTALDILAEVMNPQTSSSAGADLSADWTVLSREAAKVKADALQLVAIRDRTFGTLPPPGGDPWVYCKAGQDAPTVVLGQDCLEVLLDFENAKFDPAALSYGDEEEFRRLVVRDNDAIQMVQTLGALLGRNTTQLSVSLATFDSDLAQYRADLNVFASNMQATEDAKQLLETLREGRFEDTERLQIRAKLGQALNTGTQSAIDPTELNLLAEDYVDLARSTAGNNAIDRAKDELGEQLSKFASNLDELTGRRPTGAPPTMRFGIYARNAADQIAAPFTKLVEDANRDLNQTLPGATQSINTLQSRVLARTNEIYDLSRVPMPLVKQFNISALSGNVIVYYTIRQVETFPRFAVPPLAQQPTSASPPALAAAPTPSSTATASTNPASTPATSPGVVVSHGAIQVHALYKATMVAAFAFSGVGETTFSTSSITSNEASDKSACTSASPCTQIKVSRGPDHASVLLGLSYHFYEYDSFPGATETWRSRLGAMGGLSVQNVNDYYAAFDVQAAHGIQIMLGGNFYRQNQLSPNFANGGIYPGTITSFTGPQHWTLGIFGGMGLNLSIFRKAFGSVTGVGAGSAKSAGG